MLHLFAPSTLTDMRLAFERAGYRCNRASYRLEIELDDPVDPPILPEGIEIRTLGPHCRVRSEIGWVGILAVLRPWRRRGIGPALLRHSFCEVRRRGFERVGLGVDAESLTGANRLYEAAGIHVVRQLDLFEKRLG